MASSEESKALFLGLLRDWAPAYRYVVRNVLAVREIHGQKIWHGTVYLLPEVGPGLVNFSVTTENLFAGRDVIPISRAVVADLISNFLERPGELNVAGNAVTLGSSTPDDVWFHTYPITHPKFPGPMRFPGALLTSKSRNIVRTPDDEVLDLELLTANTPYRGLVDLLGALNFSPNSLSRTNAPNIEWILAAPVSFDQGEINNEGETEIKLRHAGHFEDSGFKFGFNIISREKTERGYIEKSALTWATESGQRACFFRLDLRGASVAVFFVSYRGTYLGQSIFFNKARSFNLLYDAVRVFDKNRFLSEKVFSTKDADAFEESVGLLFGLLGLEVNKFGAIPELSDAPDMLARSKEGHLYVVECTTASPDNKGKLFRLYQRVNDLREANEKNGWGFRDIRPVLVTALPRADTAEHHKNCAEWKISLVCKEDLIGLASRLEFPPTATEIFDAAINAVPRSHGTGDLFGDQ